MKRTSKKNYSFKIPSMILFGILSLVILSSCKPYQKLACSGSLPAHAQYNSGSSNYKKSLSGQADNAVAHEGSLGSCSFKCDAGYGYNLNADQFGAANTCVSSILKAKFTSVALVGKQIQITGTDLDSISNLKIQKGTDPVLATTIASRSGSTSLVLEIGNALSFVTNESFKFLISNAQGAEIPIDAVFSVADRSITVNKLQGVLGGQGVVAGQSPVWNGTDWVAQSPSASQLFISTFDASLPAASALAALNATPNIGDYYIVSKAGDQDLNGTGTGAVHYGVGDWIMYDATGAWKKIAASNAITSVFGRLGDVVAQAGDYTWSMLKKVGTKIEGSSIGDIADVDFTTAPVNGEVLTYDGASSKWMSKASTGSTTSTTTTTSATFQTDVMNSVLTGLNVVTNSAISASDGLIAALGKLQAQISGQETVVAGHTATLATHATDIAANATAIASKLAAIDITQSITAANLNTTTINGTAVPSMSDLALKTGATFTGPLVSSGDMSVNGMTVGLGAGQVGTNLAIGSQALLSNTTGNSNVAIGIQALKANTVGSSNLSIGALSLYSNTTGGNNVSIGQESLYTAKAVIDSVAVGYQSQRYANDTLIQTNTANTSVGFQSLYGSTTATNNTGIKNTAIGANSLFSNTTGIENTATGYFSLVQNTTGKYNTAIGSQSLWANTTGYGNTANGYSSLYANTIGYYNTSIGREALSNNTTGYENTGVGYFAGIQTSTGVNNTSLGSLALRGNIIGSNNTSIGKSSLLLVTGSNNTALGASSGSAIITGSNNVVIGSNTGTSIATLNNNILISDGSGNIRMVMDATGTTNGTLSGTGSLPMWATAYNVTSDQRLKKDIKVIPDALEKLLTLSGVSYNWDHSFHPELKLGDKPQLGVLAQQVEKTFPQAVSTNEKTGIKSVAYTMLIAPIIEAIRELKEMVFGHSKEIERLSNQVKKLELQNKAIMDHLCKTSSIHPKSPLCLSGN